MKSSVRSICSLLILLIGITLIDCKRTRADRYSAQPIPTAASFGNKTKRADDSGEIVITNEPPGRFHSIDTWRKQLKSIIHDDSETPTEPICGQCDVKRLWFTNPNKNSLKADVMHIKDTVTGCMALRVSCQDDYLFTLVDVNDLVRILWHRHPVDISCGLDGQWTWYRNGSLIAVSGLYCSQRPLPTPKLTRLAERLLSSAAKDETILESPALDEEKLKSEEKQQLTVEVKKEKLAEVVEKSNERKEQSAIKVEKSENEKKISKKIVEQAPVDDSAKEQFEAPVIVAEKVRKQLKIDASSSSSDTDESSMSIESFISKHSKALAVVATTSISPPISELSSSSSESVELTTAAAPKSSESDEVTTIASQSSESVEASTIVAALSVVTESDVVANKPTEAVVPLDNKPPVKEEKEFEKPAIVENSREDPLRVLLETIRKFEWQPCISVITQPPPCALKKSSEAIAEKSKSIEAESIVISAEDEIPIVVKSKETMKSETIKEASVQVETKEKVVAISKPKSEEANEPAAVEQIEEKNENKLEPKQIEVKVKSVEEKPKPASVEIKPKESSEEKLKKAAASAERSAPAVKETVIVLKDKSSEEKVKSAHVEQHKSASKESPIAEKESKESLLASAETKKVESAEKVRLQSSTEMVKSKSISAESKLKAMSSEVPVIEKEKPKVVSAELLSKLEALSKESSAAFESKIDPIPASSSLSAAEVDKSIVPVEPPQPLAVHGLTSLNEKSSKVPINSRAVMVGLISNTTSKCIWVYPGVLTCGKSRVAIDPFGKDGRAARNIPVRAEHARRRIYGGPVVEQFGA